MIFVSLLSAILLLFRKKGGGDEALCPIFSAQFNGVVANEIKHVHSPEVIVVLDPRYN